MKREKLVRYKINPLIDTLLFENIALDIAAILADAQLAMPMRSWVVH